MRVGEILRPFHSPTTLNQPTDSKFSAIQDLSSRADKIWLDRKGNKNQRFKEKAEELLPHLTPEVLSDSQFYQQVDWEAHMRILKLLGQLVPRPGEETARFTGTPIHNIIESYLQEILLNRVTITKNVLVGQRGDFHDELRTVADGKSSYDDYKGKLARYLYIFSGIPRHYLDRVYPIVGLPLNHSVAASSMNQYAQAVATERTSGIKALRGID